MTAALVCPLCAAFVAVKRDYQDTGGGDGRTVVRIACHNHPRASLIAVAYGPHGYPKPDDEFKTTDEAVAAVIGAWRALS